jgi:hypothetical protein
VKITPQMMMETRLIAIHCICYSSLLTTLHLEICLWASDRAQSFVGRPLGGNRAIRPRRNLASEEAVETHHKVIVGFENTFGMLTNDTEIVFNQLRLPW